METNEELLPSKRREQNENGISYEPRKLQLSVIEEESKRGPETIFEGQSKSNMNMISSRVFQEDFIDRQVSSGSNLEDFKDFNHFQSKIKKHNSAPLHPEYFS